MIGKNLKYLRNKKGVSQDELAKAIGVTQSAIRFYEKDERNPSYEVLVNISTYFCVSTDYLIGLTEDMNKIVNVPEGYALVLSQALEEDISPERLKKLIEFAKSFDSE